MKRPFFVNEMVQNLTVKSFSLRRWSLTSTRRPDFGTENFQYHPWKSQVPGGDRRKTRFNSIVPDF